MRCSKDAAGTVRMRVTYAHNGASRSPSRPSRPPVRRVHPYAYQTLINVTGTSQEAVKKEIESVLELHKAVKKAQKAVDEARAEGRGGRSTSERLADVADLWENADLKVGHAEQQLWVVLGVDACVGVDPLDRRE